VTGQRTEASPWERFRAWWGIADLDEDGQMEWLEQEAARQSENETREREADAD